MSGGHYYLQYPYDSDGNDDPGAPWAEISRAEYVADIGTLVRQDALFSGIPLIIAWVLAGVGRDLDEE